MKSRAVSVGLVLIAAPLLSQPLQAQKITKPQPGDEKVFSDWVVACDNIKSCSAQGLMQEEESWESWISVDLNRAAGPDSAATVNFAYSDDWPATFPARETVRFTTNDGTQIPVQRARENPQGWTAKLDAAMVDRLRNAAWLQLRDPDGRIHAKASLAGLSATLRYMDDQQGRAGTVTALVARGGAAANTVPAAPATPVVRAAKISTAAPFQPSPAQWADLGKRSECDADFDEPKAYRLDATTTLLAIPCSSGAYNFVTAYYVARGAGKSVRFAPAPLDFDAGWTEKVGAAPVLVNGGFHAKDQLLSHFSKGRGIGDCGDAASWVWDGKMFRLVNIMLMNECRGSNNWLRTWIANSEAEIIKPELIR